MQKVVKTTVNYFIKEQTLHFADVTQSLDIMCWVNYCEFN